MVKYKKIYLKYFNYGEQDIILCEVCFQLASEVHHITYKSQCGKDEIKNLIGLCRSCHSMAHYLGGLKSLSLSKKELIKKHNQFINVRNSTSKSNT